MSGFGIRVFFVIPDGSPSPAHRSVVSLIGRLPRHDVEPVACFLDEGPLAEHCRDELGVETMVVAAGVRPGRVARRAARRAIELVILGARPSIVHGVGAAVHASVAGAARRAGAAAVWSQFEVPRWRSYVQVRAALAGARAVIAASRAIEAGQHRVNPARHRVLHVPPGAHVGADPRDVRWARAREALGIGPDDYLIGWLAGPDGPAEAEIVLPAAASACHARRQTRLVVVDDPASRAPDLLGAVRARAARLGIEGRLIPAPPAEGSRPSQVLEALDAAVWAPTRALPVALGPIEALAAGVPLVAGDREPIREYLVHGLDGYVVPADDSEAFAAALLALGDAPEEREAISEAAVATAKARFSVGATTRQVVALYRDLAGRPARPPAR